MSFKEEFYDQIRQARFVSELCETICRETVSMITNGKVPRNFDGHELRVILADAFNASAKMTIIKREPRSKRAKDFKNWQLCS